MNLRERCKLLHFSDLGDERGKLVVVEGAEAIPFEIKRVYYMYGTGAILNIESFQELTFHF